MLEIIKKYFKNNDYFIIITNNGFCVKNYKSIISMNVNEVSLVIDKYKYIIEGENIRINRKVSTELSFIGNINNILKYDID